MTRSRLAPTGNHSHLCPIALLSLLLISGSTFLRAADSEILYVHVDHIGTPTAMTNELQQVVWRANHLPFGKANISNSSYSNPVRFPGQYLDEEIELHYNYFRHFDPEVGRYTQSDPLGIYGELSTYNYAGANPSKFVDPLGLVRWTGTQFGAMFLTAGFSYFKLTSDCVDGKQATVTLLAAGPGFGLGLTASGSGGDVVIEDSLSFINPDALAGGFGAYFSASAALSIPLTPEKKVGQLIATGGKDPGDGLSASIIKLDEAGAASAGTIRGIDVGLNFMVGSSTVIDLLMTECLCEN